MVQTTPVNPGANLQRLEHQTILKCLDRLPPFSPVVRLLLASLSNDSDDVPLHKVVAFIEEDTVIAGKVLGVVNSAMYNRGQRICSIRQAVNRLGTGPLRNLVLGLSVNRVWSGIRVPDSFSMLRFNRHALATATLSDILARQLPIAEPSVAFVAGLFHDLGQLVLVSFFAGAYEQFLYTVSLEAKDQEDLERETFGFTHGEISAIATGFWKLPLTVQTAVRLHERSPLRNVEHEEVKVSMSDVVHAADRSVAALGFSTIDVARNEAAQLNLSQLGLDDTKVQIEFLRQFNSLTQF